jgi:hypothetical protein
MTSGGLMSDEWDRVYSRIIESFGYTKVPSWFDIESLGRLTFDGPRGRSPAAEDRTDRLVVLSRAAAIAVQRAARKASRYDLATVGSLTDAMCAIAFILGEIRQPHMPRVNVDPDVKERLAPKLGLGWPQ